jgi:2-phospho-L-lactate guanylyltransferase
MPTIVVPFRGSRGKQRLAPLSEPMRAAVAAAMLADVLAACAPLGRTLLVAPPGEPTVAETAVELVADPDDGQGAAVAAALARVEHGPVFVVNADLPCATAADLVALLDALPGGGIALAEAADGTTNALALASPRLFRPLYGAGSAARFRSLVEPGAARTVAIANLVDDVDTLDDLRRLRGRLGPLTSRALVTVEAVAGEAA